MTETQCIYTCGQTGEDMADVIAGARQVRSEYFTN